MIRVAVNKLKQGQVLAQDVIRPDGMVLITKGRSISPEVLSLLSRLGVESVVVEGDRFASAEEREAFLNRQEKALDHRFSRVEDDKVLMAVREMFRQRLRNGACPPLTLEGREEKSMGDWLDPKGGNRS